MNKVILYFDLETQGRISVPEFRNQVLNLNIYIFFYMSEDRHISILSIQLTSKK